MLIALSACLTVETGVGKPFDTNAIAELDWRVLSMCANSNNMADTLLIEFNRYDRTMSSFYTHLMTTN